MPSLVPDFEYDIFISYRQKDNKRDGWVTEFVASLKAELDATIKKPVSIYFDENPHDGLLETHQVDASLEKKLKCLIFIPIISQTYCDPTSFAWQHELLAFVKLASADAQGMNITLGNGNVASRILPIQIHDLDQDDRQAIESALSGPLRGIPFIYSSPGVNRPLRVVEDHPEDNKHKTIYRDQINKVANAIKEINTAAMQQHKQGGGHDRPKPAAREQTRQSSERTRTWSWTRINLVAALVIILVVAGKYFLISNGPDIDASRVSIGVIPFRNNTGDETMSHYGVGIASEVSTQLGLTKKFDFISSLQATIQYQESDKSPEEIGTELGVTHILTGMYQTAGDNIQVLVELVDAGTGKVIWSIPYKTKYTDIFDVQASIASQVMDKFSVSDASEVSAPTANLEAYAHYVKGLEIVLRSNIPEDRMKSLPEFQQAITLDSGFIEPWWGIIEEYCYYYWNRSVGDSISLQMIQPHMDYVERNFPESWKKKTIRGTYQYWALSNYQKGLALFLEVLGEQPTAEGVNSMVSAIYRRQLQLRESLDHLTVSLKQTPRGVIYWNELVGIVQLNGDYENALKAASTIYELNERLDGTLYRLRMWDGTLEQLPQEIKKNHGYSFLADLALQRRDFKGLLRLTDTVPENLLSSELRLSYRMTAYYLLREDGKARKAAMDFLKLKDTGTGRKANVLALLGMEQDYTSLRQWPGINIDQDLQVAWILETDMIRYYALSGNFAEADKRLQAVNNKFPQVGDYGWLNLPIYDRIKAEYPAFRETISQLKLPPKIMDTKLIKM